MPLIQKAWEFAIPFRVAVSFVHAFKVVAKGAA
jgi:hypothetical protein